MKDGSMDFLWRRWNDTSGAPAGLHWAIPTSWARELSLEVAAEDRDASRPASGTPTSHEGSFLLVDSLRGTAYLFPFAFIGTCRLNYSTSLSIPVSNRLVRRSRDDVAPGEGDGPCRGLPTVALPYRSTVSFHC